MIPKQKLDTFEFYSFNLGSTLAVVGRGVGASINPVIDPRTSHMNEQERGMIDGLFQRLREAESQAEPRDRDAEALIAERMASQPGAAYMLAQVVLVQEQGLKNLTNRVEEMERQLAERPAGGGGFLGGLFGGGGQPSARPQPTAPAAARAGWSNPRPGGGISGMQAGTQPGGQGGGFMAGAMQTAMGVAGGMLLANAVGGLFAGDAEAAPADAAAAEPAADSAIDEPPMDEPMADGGGGFFDGLFGGDEEEF
jgi:hypothetical protein